MQSRFTKKAQEALDHAAETAAMLGHGYIGSEHLLIGLIQAEDSLASTVLLNNDVTAEKIINLVYQLIAPDNQVGVKEPSGYTPRVRRILENSAKEAARFHADSIGTEHLLIAIIKETESVAARLLNTLGIAIKKLYVDTLAAMGEDANSYREDFQNGRPRGKKSTQTLDQYSRDLTELARNGKLDPVIGRSEEIQRVIQILSRRTKNNPCLIGEPGVGKTAIAEGLAARIVEGDVPETIKGKRLLTLDLSGMVAGSKYRGEFEERIKRVINEVKADGNVLLFLDELHTIIGAGGAEGAIDASNILKPSLARGEIQLIGATTLEEYRKYIEKDAALERRFQPVKVEEPTEEEHNVSIEGVRVLVAEDNDLNMEITEFVLSSVGAVVIKASNGQEAIEIFEKSEVGEIDIILMDVMMPGVDGLAATRIIRSMSREDAKTIPIIAMTANAFSEDRLRAVEAGMNEHLAKPLESTVIIKTIAKYLKEE